MHIPDEQELSDLIMQKLSENLPSVPETGIIAGGAVAGWILEKVRGRTFKLNDIDLFREKANDTDVKEYITPMRCGTTEMIPGVSFGDPMMIERNDNETYAIISTSRDGILNTVEIWYKAEADPMPTQMGHSRMTPDQKGHALINGFDLNACQACIVLDNRHVIMSEAFRKFAQDYQLMVTSPITPHHTIMRLPSKVKALGCYVNYEEEYRLLAMAPYALGKHGDSNTQFMRCFSSYHLPDYIRNRSEIDPWFTLANYTRDTKTAAESCKDRVAVAGLYQFLPKFDPRPPENICALTNMTTPALANYYDALIRQRNGKKLLTKNNTLAETRLMNSLLINNPTLTKCDYDDTHVERLTKLLSKHPYFCKFYSQVRLNIEELSCLTRAINRAAQKNGKYVYGIMETLSPTQARHLRNAIRQASSTDPDSVWTVTKECVKKILLRYEKTSTIPLTEPLDISHFPSPYGLKIRELLSVSDLQAEGAQMNHCVGGYACSIDDNESAIFNLDYAGERSTLQVRKPRTSMEKYRIIQHHGVKDVTPSQKHQQVANLLVKHLNRKRGNRQTPTTHEKEDTALCA